LGLSHTYSHNFSEVELVIIQPRAYHETGETVRTAVFTIDQLLEWDEIFKEGVKKAKDPLAPLAAGSWCRFCPAAIMCPELKENSMKRAQIVFDDEVGITSVPEAKLMTVPNLSIALDTADKLEAFIDALRKHALHVLAQGGEIPGWKLVDKRGIRKWIDLQKATQEAKRDYKDFLFTEPELKSPAQVEKVLKGEVGKAWVASRAKAISSGVTLVPESDKRPAVKPLDKVFIDEVLVD